MNIPHDKFCVLPWISLEASPIGTVRPCCLAMNELEDGEGNKYHLAHVPLDHKLVVDAGTKSVLDEQASACTHWID
jgi:hypothetical protein